MADTLYLDPFPPVLQPPDDRPFTDVIPIRPDASEVRPGDVLPQRVVALPYERIVYLTLGTFFNTAAEFAVPLDSLRDLPVNVVLTCGFGVQPEAFEPPNVAVEQYVSQALLLPRCSAVVCHAGAGTIIGALAHGVPLVCMPRGADQFGNAAQISRIGAGITLLPDQVSVETIRDATRRVRDEGSYAAAAASVKTEIERLPSPSTVVDELVRRAG